jgi:hypothetical protein
MTNEHSVANLTETDPALQTTLLEREIGICFDVTFGQGFKTLPDFTEDIEAVVGWLIRGANSVETMAEQSFKTTSARLRNLGGTVAYFFAEATERPTE